MKYHIAQINIAKLKKPLDHPDTHGFTSRLDEINNLAAQADGFVWRFEEDGVDNTTEANVLGDDMIVVNISIWESIEALKKFAYHTAHVEVYRDRQKWMENMIESHMALWWVPKGELTTLEQSIEKLLHIRAHGPTPTSFHFGKLCSVEEYELFLKNQTQ